MKNNPPNISKVAQDLILAYQQLTNQQQIIVIQPRDEKTALYLPQSRTHIIKYIIQLLKRKLMKDSPTKTITKEDEDYLLRTQKDSRLNENQIYEHTLKIFIRAFENNKLMQCTVLKAIKEIKKQLKHKTNLNFQDNNMEKFS